MPLLKSDYKPPFYLKNAHLATIVPSSFRKVPGVLYERERIPTSDDDFLDLDWLKKGTDKLVIISHGLEGSSDRPYSKGMAKYFHLRGWDALAWNCRSCSGEMNNQPRFYHHGATDDLDEVIKYVISQYGYSQIVLVGFSMGGSLTLKYIGERGDQLPKAIQCGVAYSVPVNLASSVQRLASKGNDFYRKRFLRKLEEKIRAKARAFPEQIRYQDFNDIKYFSDFDNRYTAPLHGYKDADDFYSRASAEGYMFNTVVPLLLVNALNDPFLAKELVNGRIFLSKLQSITMAVTPLLMCRPTGGKRCCKSNP